jgi:formamidopyrimidine-DNA glycosylase
VPELPEVETIARKVASRVTGDTIESVWLGSKPEPLKSSAEEIARTLEGARIARVRRMGKHIVFDLERGGRRSKRRKGSQKADERAHWIVHLGMSGSLRVCEPALELARHTHAVVKMKSGCELRFVDPRRFGRLSVSADGFETAGVEPLDIGFEVFAKLFRGRKTPIKSALLNQKLLRGVGNIYADEALARAGVRPRRRAASLSREELRRLYRSVQKVLVQAITAGGSSISDYVGADGEPGMFQVQHRVYGREGEPCLKCRRAIKRVVIAGRSSHYCPHCQK